MEASQSAPRSNLEPLSVAIDAGGPPATTIPLQQVQPQHIHEIRLLFPSLLLLPYEDLVEAFIRTSQEQRIRLLQSQRGELLGTSRPYPDADEIARYRLHHPGTHWMTDGGVAALILWRWGRYAWLLHETHTYNSGSPDAPAEPSMPPATPQTQGQRNIQQFIQSYVPSAQPEELTDQDVADFKAECKTTAQLPEGHIRSIMMYFRQRQRRREAAMTQRIHAGLNANDSSKMAVPAQAIHDRITYLQQAQAIGPRRTLNLQVAAELQRILAEETGYRSSGSGLVDSGTQTLPSLAMASGALPSTERVVVSVERSEFSDTTEEDVSMMVDEYDDENDEAGEGPSYLDAFEEWHSFL
jgi:hypothetical protein